MSVALLSVEQRIQEPVIPPKTAQYGLGVNYAMPELVPDFGFHGRLQHQLLVDWLDALCATGVGVGASLKADPEQLSVDAFQAEWEVSSDHELICAKLVTGWLLQRIRSETEVIPQKLLGADEGLAKRLGCNIGGCGNISWIYNWQHPEMQPGTPYSYRTLIKCFENKDTSLRPRFTPIGGEVATSFEPFIMVHIEMEAYACAMTEKSIQAQDKILAGKAANAEMAEVAARGRDMLGVFTQCFNSGLVSPTHWPHIQKTLHFPEYTGMSSAQNISIQLLGEAVAVGVPGHEYNQNLHDIAELGFVPHQRKVLQFVRDRRDVMRDYALSTRASADERASYNALVKVSVMWRGSHKKHVMKYVAAALEKSKGQYVTSTGHQFDAHGMGVVFESRMEDYSKLELRSKL